MSTSSPEKQTEFIRLYFEGLNCPRALTCWLLYSQNEHQQLVDLTFEPTNYNTLVDARDSLAATKFLSKASFLNLEVDRAKVAMDGFIEAEWVCAETNRRIQRSLFSNEHTNSVIMLSAFEIAKVLGEFDADEFVESCNFGPGATTAIKRRCASHPKKFDSENRITKEAYEFVKSWIAVAYPLWDPQMVVQGESKVVTVPKNAKTDRTIAIEPGLNLWFQKGIGSMLRKRLRSAGIDLNDQSHNQRRARLASKSNLDATVDFSMASDTIARRLVQELIPEPWHSVLESFRSSFCVLPGSNHGRGFHNFEKFSSMGNGFTFELESLIFWSIAVALCKMRGISEKRVSVYGDDVILPSVLFDEYCSICKDLGFTVNRTKSYSSSYYRESCGSHYWGGTDIKPIFLKEELQHVPYRLVVANELRRYSHRRVFGLGCDSQLRSSYNYLTADLKRVPVISEGFGDVGLIGNIEECATEPPAPKHGYEGRVVKVWAPLAHTYYCESQGLLLSKLKAMGASYDSEPLGHRCIGLVKLRSGFVTYRQLEARSRGNNIPLPHRARQARIRLLIPRWYVLGPWI